MKPTTEIGKNRTGIAMSPVDAADVIQEARSARPSTEGDGEALDVVRLQYDEDAGPLGTVPPPASLKGAVKVAGQALKGERPTVLLDKLGERLAFERTGVRLYEALIHKRKTEPNERLEPSVAELEQFCGQEARHFKLIAECIRKLGGDPTVETPSADLVGVLSSGIPKVLTDPRTTFRQGLEAILVAELADNDGWRLLIELAPNDEMRASFENALEQEDEHLASVRNWVESGLVS